MLFKWSVVFTGGQVVGSLLMDGVKDFIFNKHGLVVLKTDGSLHRKADLNSQLVKTDDFTATDCTSMKMVSKDRVALASFTTNIVKLSILSLSNSHLESVFCQLPVDKKGRSTSFRFRSMLSAVTKRRQERVEEMSMVGRSSIPPVYLHLQGD